MKKQHSGIWLSYLLMMLILGSFGCGGGINNAQPSGSVSATQHPLVAQYDVVVPRPGASTWVEFGTDTTYGRQTLATTTTQIWQTVNVLVAGMRPRTMYHMRAHAEWNGGSWVDQDRTFKTGAIPPSIVVPTFTVTQPDANLTPSSGVELLSLVPASNSVDTLLALVTDVNGNVLWYYDVGKGNFPFPLRPLPNGHFAVVVSQSLQAGPDLREIDLAGNLVSGVTVDQVNASLQANGYSFTIGFFHHDVLMLPDGDWMVIGGTYKTFTDLPGYPGTTAVSGDALIEVTPTGNVVWAWSEFDHLDVNRHPFGLPDWTHGNAIVYTPNDGNLLFSMRNQSWVVKIDYENGKGTGDILWRLGDGGDFTLAGGDPAQWFYGQHYPNPLSINGSQMLFSVFDDGNNRILDSNGDTCGTPGFIACYSRGVIYQVFEDTRTAAVDWQYAPPGLFTFWGGSIGQLVNGDIEFDLSEPFFQDPTSSEMIEATQSSNPAVVWDMVIKGANAYRAYRIPSLYPGVTWK
jgi:arylsulfate sulfotransferase